MPKDRIRFFVDGKEYDIKAKKGESEFDLAVRAELKKREIQEGEVKINKTITVKQWSEEWLETYKRPSIESSTFSDYRSRFNNQINPVIGNMRLCEVKSLHCQNVLNKMGGYSKDRINKISHTMKEMFKDAIKNELIKDNPASDLVKPKAEDGTHRAITEAERRSILELAKTHRGGLWMKLTLYCGLRPGESAALMWQHIDFKDRKVNVRQALKKSGKIGPPKSKASIRSIPIPSNLLTELQAIKGNPFEYVLQNKNGSHLTNRNLCVIWKNFKRELNIVNGCRVYRNEVVPPYWVADDLVPYCLRHTFCTDLQAAGVPINVAKELMGHSDLSTTAKIYTHQSDVAFENARNAIDEYYMRINCKSF